MPRTFVDNDIVFKLLRIGHLDDLASCLGHGEDEMAVLGTLRFKIGRLLKDDIAARESFDVFLERVEEAEPSDAEIVLAARLEEAAQLAGHAVDGGESILFAMAITRGARVATGDKRAVAGLAAIAESEPACNALVSAVVTMEWLASALVERYGVEPVRTAVCAFPNVDRALEICFQCRRSTCSPASVHAALSSYQRDLAGRTNGFVPTDLPATV